MKIPLTILPLLAVFTAGAQFSDSFSDGDFTRNPAWMGDTALFAVNPDRQLRLSASVADTAFLSTPSGVTGPFEWSFWLKMSFNTSANNHARVYLVSDLPGLAAPLNGIFLQAGGADDSVRFFRQQSHSLVPVFTCPQLFTGRAVTCFRFRITFDTAGTWAIWADTTGGNLYLPVGTFTARPEGTAGYFGIWCRFTASNGTKFYFDDFHAGPVIHDTLPPGLAGVRVEGDDSLVVLLTEPADPSSVQTDRFTLLGNGVHPATAAMHATDPGRIILSFAEPFPDPSCDTVVVSGITDAAGNAMEDTRGAFCRHSASAYEVLITEILADPDPPEGLPASEFTEILNRSEFPVAMEGWTFSYGSYSRTFPDVTLSSGEYLLITADTAYRQFGRVVPLFTSGYSLPNEGASLALRDEKGHVIHAVRYSQEWFNGSYKEEGGWTLEIADPANPCGCGENWLPSADPAGGTPGRVNSVHGSNPDTVSPRMLRAAVTTGNRVTVFFSESMDSLSLSGNVPWMINDTALTNDAVHFVSPDFSTLELTWPAGFSAGRFFTVNAPEGCRDCAGNLLPAGSSVQAAVPGIPGPGDIVLNEILADPYPGGSRFIEVYNRSGTPFALSDLLFEYGTGDSAGGSFSQCLLSPGPFLLLPGDYAAICENGKDVMQRYGDRYPERFVTNSDLPAISGTAGRLALLRACDGAAIDRVDYTAGMHHPLLSSTEGISLERIDPGAASQDPGNWHSAAASAGYATPGEINSQWWSGEVMTDDAVSIDPEVFSPDNDGRDDVLHISCHPGTPGWLATVVIYDSRGRKVATVAANELISPEGSFTWDGRCDAGGTAAAGIYVLFVELLDTDGVVKHYRKTAAVAVRR